MRKNIYTYIWKLFFKCFKADPISHFQPNLAKVKMTILCSHKIKTQWSGRPKELVSGTFIAKFPCDSVSGQVILSLGWVWEEGKRNFSQGSCKKPEGVLEGFQGSLLHCESQNCLNISMTHLMQTSLALFSVWKVWLWRGRGRFPPTKSFVHVYSSKSLDFKYTWWMTLCPWSIISVLSVWADSFSSGSCGRMQFSLSSL